MFKLFCCLFSTKKALVIFLSCILNSYAVVGTIIFVPKLCYDGPSSELLSQSQLPISCENLVSKGAKQSNWDQKTGGAGFEWELGKAYCKTSDKRGKYTPSAYRRPRVPGNSKVFNASSHYPERSMEKDLFTSLGFEVSSGVYLA